MAFKRHTKPLARVTVAQISINDAFSLLLLLYSYTAENSVLQHLRAHLQCTTAGIDCQRAWWSRGDREVHIITLSDRKSGNDKYFFERNDLIYNSHLRFFLFSNYLKYYINIYMYLRAVTSSFVKRDWFPMMTKWSKWIHLPTWIDKNI